MVDPVLRGIPNVRLIEPLEYGAMAALLRESTLIVTDSGGLQEEGAALGVPVVVVRNVTERPEGVASGILRLAGTDPWRLTQVVAELLASDRNGNACRQLSTRTVTDMLRFGWLKLLLGVWAWPCGRTRSPANAL